VLGPISAQIFSPVRQNPAKAQSGLSGRSRNSLSFNQLHLTLEQASGTALAIFVVDKNKVGRTGHDKSSFKARICCFGG
jgi:hypothetical protein